MRLDTIESYISSLPEWIQLTKSLATERGFKTVDGLRKHCFNTLHHDDMRQINGKWHIKTAVIHHIKPKITKSMV
jgi:hypothetical protein